MSARTGSLFLVRWDFRKATTFGPSSRKAFGERNAGATVEAESAAEAVKVAGALFGLNPFYLVAEPVK